VKRGAYVSLALTLAGCHSCSRQPEVHTESKDAAVAVVAPDSGAAPALMSLLSFCEARVAVSSTVRNPHDFPEHLIDGKADTAWNGKTGDLVGGFIAFRVPREARVDRVRLTAGFDKIAKDGRDLFTGNHRMKKLRILRDGALLREATLNVELRGLQSIAIDAAGGDYKLEVTETVAGTVAAWKELTVSEFQVLGDPGPKRLASPVTPRVRVGSLDAAEYDAALPSTKSMEGWPSLKAYCARFRADHEAEVRAQFSSPDFPCQDPSAHAVCATIEHQRLEGLDEFRAITQVNRADESSDDTDYVVEVADGAFARIAGEGHGRCELGDPGSNSVEIVSVEGRRTAAGAPVVLVVSDSKSFSPMYSDPDTGEPAMWVSTTGQRMLTVCRLDASKHPTCNEGNVLGTFETRDGSTAPFEAWQEKKTFTLTPDGGVTLSPR